AERAHLASEAAAYQAWEDSQIRQCLEEKMDHGGTKRRCVLQIEASSSSGDRPRLRHVFSMEVPDNGSSVSLVIRAQMEQDPEDVATQLVPSPGPHELAEAGQQDNQGGGTGQPVESVQLCGDGGSESLEAQRGTVPDLLPHMEFAEYEQVYNRWRNGELSLAELSKVYGHEVAAQNDDHREIKGERVMDTQLDGSGTGPMPSSGSTSSGITLVPFTIMKHVYRKWLDGSISEATLLQVYGQSWVDAFRVIRSHGMAAGRPLLEHMVRWDSCSMFEEGDKMGPEEFGEGDS
ncbi:KCBP, partial [Symbiodinium microadriaticum]